MNNLIKRMSDDDGVGIDNDHWHLYAPAVEVNRILCTGEAMDEDSEIVIKEKSVMRGGITCPKCLELIKTLKKVRL